MKSKIYLNGSIVSEDRALVSIFDRGLNYGDGLFETLKAENGKPAFLKEHLKRLKNSAKVLKIPAKALEADVKKNVIERLLKANGLTKSPARVKIIITRGADRGTHALPKNARPTHIIVAKALDEAYIRLLQTRGVKAVLIRNWTPNMGGLKTLNYLPNVIAKAEAERRGAFEGIFVDKNNMIKEGTSTNVFIISKGVLKTPAADKKTGILPGVTRAAVIKVAKNLGLPVTEGPVYVKDLLACDRAFLTNSIIGMVPLVSVDSKRIGKKR